MASHHPIRKSIKPDPAAAPVIPDKLYFRIGDVARLLDVPAYVLRFWETEFPQLKPNKGGTGQRLYRRKDVETALRIKGLLYDQGYTIPGARQALRSDSTDATQNSVILSGAPERSDGAESKDPAGAQAAHAAAAFSTSNTNPALHALRDELRSLCAQLSRPVGDAAPAKVKSIRAHAPAESSLSLNQQDLFPSE